MQTAFCATFLLFFLTYMECGNLREGTPTKVCLKWFYAQLCQRTEKLDISLHRTGPVQAVFY